MIHIQLFERLIMSLSIENKIKEVSFTAKPGCFVAYLLLNRNRAVSKEELLEAFWNNSSDTNPNSALKTLVHRTRKQLTQGLGEQNYILEENGSYRWNDSIAVELDIEQFEKNIRRAVSEPMEDEDAIALYESTLEMYKDDFLSRSKEYYWVDVQAAYYNTLLIKGLENLISLYKRKKNYKKIEYVCDSCAQRNMIDENIFYYQIMAKVLLNKREEARRTYNRSLKILKKELDITHPWKIEALRDKVYYQENTEQTELQAICDEIEQELLRGALECHYLTFKEICRLEYRRMQRENFLNNEEAKQRQVMLLSAYHKSPEKKEESILTDDSMEAVIEIIRKNLRAGDVISRCSVNQCVLLLYGCSDKDLVNVTKRLLDAAKENLKSIHCRFQYKQLSSDGFSL